MLQSYEKTEYKNYFKGSSNISKGKGGGVGFLFGAAFYRFPAGGCSSLPSNGVAISWQDFPATWTEN